MKWDAIWVRVYAPDVFLVIDSQKELDAIDTFNKLLISISYT